MIQTERGGMSFGSSFRSFSRSSTQSKMLSLLGDSIVTLIDSMLNMHTNFLTGIAHLVSERSHVGRTSTPESYADNLLSCEIVVVAQRDRWEDHLRLFEALSAGGYGVVGSYPPPTSGSCEW